MCLENNHLSLLERDVQRRDWRCCRLEVVLEQIGQGETLCRQPTRVLVTPCDTSGRHRATSCFFLHQSTSLQQLEQWFRTYDPILCCRCVAIPKGFHICCATLKPNIQRSVLDETRLLETDWSNEDSFVLWAGVAKRSQFPLEGRIHIDLSSSFMFREGGLDGLYELARVSATRISDASRKSPGSVISAIQYRVAMEDGVLVPWKKRVLKNQVSMGFVAIRSRRALLGQPTWCLCQRHRARFCKSFPSIIATRNISPETLNCSCCQPAKNTTPLLFTRMKPKAISIATAAVEISKSCFSPTVLKCVSGP